MTKESESVSNPDVSTLEFARCVVEKSLNDRWHFHHEK